MPINAKAARKFLFVISCKLKVGKRGNRAQKREKALSEKEIISFFTKTH